MAPQLQNQLDVLGTYRGDKPGNYTTVHTHLEIGESLINYPIPQHRHVYLCGSPETFQTSYNMITKPDSPTN